MAYYNSEDRYGYGDGKPGNNSVAYTSTVQLKEIQKTQPLRVLSEEDWKFWQTYGYVVIQQAIPQEYVQRTIDFLWEFQEMDPNDPSTWYKDQLRDHEMKELNNSGMVEAYNAPVLWDNRQYQRVYDAFVDIWDSEKLWVTIDRANLNPPNREKREFSGFIHWDCDTTLDPPPINVQGVLSLVDSTPTMGGFQCVPELFRTFEDWKTKQPADRDPWVPDLAGFDVEPIALKAGDLLIFNSLQAHGIRPNQSDQVRMAQYIAMTPAQEGNEELREWRVRSWREREAPQGYAFPGDPREWEKTKYPQAQLTELGKRLLGLENWNTNR